MRSGEERTGLNQSIMRIHRSEYRESSKAELIDLVRDANFATTVGLAVW
jgi:hypothetical protein